jgi:hypothetical protein
MKNHELICIPATEGDKTLQNVSQNEQDFCVLCAEFLCILKYHTYSLLKVMYNISFFTHHVGISLRHSLPLKLVNRF